VFWVKADRPEALDGGLATFASLLRLPEAGEPTFKSMKRPYVCRRTMVVAKTIKLTSGNTVARGGSVVFDFRMGREREGPKRFLGNFEGILQSDGYGAYDHVGGKQIVYAACWAHARRKFFDAVQLNANDQTSIRIVAQMNELFAIDAQARDERFKQNRSSTSTDGEIQTVTGPNQDDDRGSSRQSTSQECPRQGVQ